MNLRYRVYYFLAGCLGLWACGCGGEPLFPAEGTVTFNGVPVEGANVTFFPQDEQRGAFAVGVTDQQGKFELHTGNRGYGALEGKYTVLIAKLDLPVLKPGEGETEMLALQMIPRDLLPPAYSDRNRTPFQEIEVPRGGKIDFVFDLKGSASN